MDPLRRLGARPLGRGAVVAVIAGAAVVLGVSVVVAAVGGGGSESSLPAVTVRSPPSPSPTSLLVQVTGAVRRPGLVSLPEGARAVDAVAAAGGTTAHADPGAVNLAAPVADGQQLVIPVRGAAPPAGSIAPSAGAAVSLNAATAEQLETLPRIGPALAARILAYRAAHGRFRTIDELGEVGGIGPKTLAGMRDRLTL